MQAQLDIDSPQLIQRITQAIASQRCFIDKYQLCCELGAGGFARVYKCIWGGSYFAIKIYMYNALKDKYPPEAYQKLKGYIEKEAELMKECKSVHVVKCFQTFSSQYYKFLVLQYCKDETLKDFLFRKGGTLDQDTAVAIMRQICLGLTEMHKRRIVHRDLKLENIMVANGVCKIIDLGLARKIEEESEIIMTNVGTNYTKAPEIKNHQRSGLKADIYSLGIIYLILISNCEYDQRNRYNFYYDTKRLFSRPVSDQSKDFIKKTVEVDQFSRIGWQDLLKHPLFSNFQPSQSQVSVVDVSFRSIALDESLADNFLEEPELRSSHLRSSIFQEEANEKIEEELFAPIYEPAQQSQTHQLLLTHLHLEQPALIQSQSQEFQYSDSTRFYYLQCEKAQFTFDLLREIDKLGKLRDQSEKVILQYLLSLHAVSLLTEALLFYEANHFDEFVPDVALIKKEALRKYENYKKNVSRMLSNVKTAFIQNQILRNYDRLKSFLNHSFSNEKTHLNEEHIILVSFYLQKLAAKSLSKKMKLLSYKEVMLISLQDIEGSSFSAKVAQISAKHQY